MKLPPLAMAYSLFPSLLRFVEKVNLTLQNTPELGFNSNDITLPPPFMPSITEPKNVREAYRERA